MFDSHRVRLQQSRLVYALGFLFLFMTAPASAAVIISEFMASNNNTLNDEDGDSSDWIELHNNGAVAVDLSGWHLTDDDTDLAQWPILDLTLAAGEYRVIFASGKGRDTGELHTNFKLGSGGEYLALVQADGVSVVSEYAPEYPQQYTDISYGIEGASVGYFRDPTPGAVNGDTAEGVVQETQSSIDHGFYDATQSVALSTDTAGADIRYTTDGSTPAGGQGCLPPANGDRLAYEYYEGSWSELPDFDALTPVATGTTNDMDFSLRQRDTQFGFRFRGCIDATDAGEYRFFTTSNDGSQLRIGGNLVVNNDGLHDSREVGGSIFLAKGLHPVTVTAFQASGGHELAVNWIPPEGADSKADSIRVTADDTFTLYVNGTEIGSNPVWQQASEFSVALKPGDVIAVEAQDLGGQGGLFVDISANGRRYESTHEWKVTDTLENGWAEPGFNDSGWAKAVEIGSKGISPWFQNVAGLPADSTASWIWGEDNTTQDQAWFRYRLPGGIKRPLQAAAFRTYSAPISIDKTTTLRSIAVKAGYLDSLVRTQTYIFPADVVLQSQNGQPQGGWPAGPINGQIFDYGMDPEIVAPNPQAVIDSLKSIPSISVVTDQSALTSPETGIYSNAQSSGRDWERAASIELIDPSASEPGFTINGGIRMRGGFSRSGANPKHAMRMFFRGQYEGDLEYPVYGESGAQSFEKLDLRTSQNYSWAFRGDEKNTFLREIWSRDTFAAMGNETTRSRYFHLYLNGVYWGLFMSQERVSKEFATSYFGGDEGSYDVVKHDRNNNYRFDATDGLDLEWRKMHRYINDQSVDNTEYANINAQVDLDNLIDIMLLNAYSSDLDGSPSWFLRSGSIRNSRGNNWYALRERNNPDSKWRFFDHDSEHTLKARRTADEMDRLGPFAPFNGEANSFFSDPAYMHPYWLHEALVSNVNYRQRVIDRVDLHFRNGGVFTPASALARWSDRRAQVSNSILAESARWGDAKNATPFTTSDWLTEVSWVETNIFPSRHTEVLQQLLARGLATELEKPQVTVNGGDLTLSNPNGVGTIYYTTDGRDPRANGGGVSGSAIQAANGLTLSFGTTTTVIIRIWTGTEWSAPIEIVIQGNSAPVITDPGSLHSSIGVDIVQFIDATDINGDPLTYSATGLPSGLGIDPNSGAITGTTDSTGTFASTINVSDGVLVSSLNLSWTVYPRARILLNEYNAVSGSKWLDGGDGSISTPADTNFGRIEGNGGDWFELVIVEDGLDLRGWSLEIYDNGALDETLEFGNETELAALPAGAILTVVENPITRADGSVITEDLLVDPVNDDWSMTLVAGTTGTGSHISASEFKVSNDNWQLVIKDASDNVVYGPAGEGAGGLSGVGSEEVAKLEENPSPLIHPGSDYNDGTSSTFGLPNIYAAGALEQDFAALRDSANVAPVVNPIADVSVNEGDSVTIVVQASDANNDSLAYSATGLPSGITVNSVSGLIDGVAAVGSAGLYTVTVLVDDGVVSSSVEFSITVSDAGGARTVDVADVVVNEGAGSVDVSITLSSAASTPVQVGIHTRNDTAQGGQDFFGFTTNPVVFSPGQTQASVSLTVIDDSDIEATETLLVRLFSPQGVVIGKQFGEISIIDNDAPVSAEFSVSDVTVSEGDGEAEVTVSLSQALADPVAVSINTTPLSAQGGQDFYGFSRRLVFAPGESSKVVAVVVLDDQIVEASEQFRVRLYNPDGADIQNPFAFVTITDNDGQVTPTVSIEATTVNEADGTVLVDVKLSQALSQLVSVGVHTRSQSARGGQDFFGFTTTVTFPAGSTTQQISLQIVDDQVAEPTESMLLRLFSANGVIIDSEITAITILDDD